MTLLVSPIDLAITPTAGSTPTVMDTSVRPPTTWTVGSLPTPFSRLPPLGASQQSPSIERAFHAAAPAALVFIPTSALFAHGEQTGLSSRTRGLAQHDV